MSEIEDGRRFSAKLGAAIRAAAAFDGKTLRQLSNETGIEYVTLGRYIRGERDMPVSVLYRCALHLNTNVRALVEDVSRREGWTR